MGIQIESIVKMMWKEVYNKINNTNLKEWSINNFKRVDKNFYKLPASSTGKYHLNQTNTEGGLYKHTIITIRVAEKLRSLQTNILNFTDEEWDIIYLSLAFHDIQKYGVNNSEKYCTFSHPIESANFLTDGKKENVEEQVKLIKKAIKCHNGKFNSVEKWGRGDEDLILPTPETKLEELIHICDVISAMSFFDDLKPRSWGGTKKSRNELEKLSNSPALEIVNDETSTQQEIDELIEKYKNKEDIKWGYHEINAEEVQSNIYIEDYKYKLKELFENVENVFLISEKVCPIMFRKTYKFIVYYKTNPIFNGEEIKGFIT